MSNNPRIKVQTTGKEPSATIKLLKVRLSFPALFEAKAFSEDQEPKFSASFLLDKKANALDIKAIKEALVIVGDAKWGKGKWSATKVKIGLRDGSEKAETDGYGEDVMFLGASSKKRVPVVGADLTPVEDSDGLIYAGCYVNASVRCWAQDNKWGKRLNFALRSVQFAADGESFGDKAEDPNETWSDISGDANVDGDGAVDPLG